MWRAPAKGGPFWCCTTISAPRTGSIFTTSSPSASRCWSPHHPGYGKSERPEWLRSVRDVAVIHQWLLSDLEIERPSLIGLGFGGWIAAEMAMMAPRSFHRLVLVGAMGLKPPEGDIFDQAIVSYLDYARAGFHDQQAFAKIYGDVSTDQLVEWDLCREMCFRIAWKPYMYSQTLPHLLGGVRAPALVVWGDDDKIVPRVAGERYAALLPKARFEIVRAPGIASRWSSRTNSPGWSALSSQKIKLYALSGHRSGPLRLRGGQGERRRQPCM